MLEQRRAKDKGYITLKEAAELSNYSSDYIGQLIRAGKIEGEQVYSNVAWVTTETSVRAYMAAKEKGSYMPKKQEGNIAETVESFGVYLLYVLIAFLAVACVVLFYVFSVTLDRHVTERLMSQETEPLIELGLLSRHDE